MSGIAPATGLPAGYPPNDYLIWKMGYDNAWQKVFEPISNEPRATPPFPGVGLPGLFAWRRQQVVGGQVGVVIASKLGIASALWRPSDPSGLYAAIVARLRTALAGGGTLAGALLVDGTNDAAAKDVAANGDWDLNWSTTLAALALDVPALSGKPLYYYQLPATRPSFITDVSWQAVRTLQAGYQSASRIMVPARDSGPWLAGSSNVQVHLTAAGFDLLAQDFVAAL